MSLKRFVTALTAATVLFSGCGEKKAKEPVPAPKKPEPMVNKEEVEPAEKLFDEFYDDSVAIEASKKKAKQAVTKEPAKTVAQERETPKEVAQEETFEPNFTPDGRYVVQISCIASEDIADDVAKKFEKKGYPIYVAEVKNPTPMLMGTYFRIRIGGFETMTDARSFGEGSLVKDGYDYWIDNRSNDNIGIGDMGLGDEPIFEDDTPVEETPARPVVEASSNDFIVEEVKEVTKSVTAPVETVKEVKEAISSGSADERAKKVAIEVVATETKAVTNRAIEEKVPDSTPKAAKKVMKSGTNKTVDAAVKDDAWDAW